MAVATAFCLWGRYLLYGRISLAAANVNRYAQSYRIALHGWEIPTPHGKDAGLQDRGGQARKDRRELREELLNCRQALQRIGRNVNQIARAANKMALADNAAEIAGELQKVNDLRAAIGAAVEGIGAATKADLSYWEVSSERL